MMIISEMLMMIIDQPGNDVDDDDHNGKKCKICFVILFLHMYKQVMKRRVFFSAISSTKLVKFIVNSMCK